MPFQKYGLPLYRIKRLRIMLVDVTKVHNEEWLKSLFDDFKKDIPEWRKVPYEDFLIYVGLSEKNHIETGIYETLDGVIAMPVGFDFTPTWKQEFGCMDKYNEGKTIFDEINPFGVADNIEQVKEYLKPAIEDKEKKFFIYYTRIWQDDTLPENGWRWHKWGPYIGNLEPKCEYLHDERFGDWQGYVICWHIIEID